VLKLLGFNDNKLSMDIPRNPIDRIAHARLGQVLEHVDTSNAMIIMFVPDNPIRQMVAELVLNGSQEPPPINCAPWQIDNKARTNVSEESADLTNKFVQDLLEHRYKAHDFTGAHTNMIPGLGKTCLYIHHDVLPPTPESHTPFGRSPWESVGNTPEKTTTPNYSVPNPTGNTPDPNEYRNPSRESKESQGDQSISYIGFLPLEFSPRKKTSKEDSNYHYWLKPNWPETRIW
jgi:hypothetical protein